MNDTAYLTTPLGLLKIEASDNAVCSVDFADEHAEEEFRECGNSDVLNLCITQLQEYFSGKRRTFTVPLRVEGTEFQMRVWNELLKIPYGDIEAYSEIAVKIGGPKYSRAVGNACNRNRIAIIIPCHRVKGKDGSLTGYAGGTDKKEYLINLEKKYHG